MSEVVQTNFNCLKNDLQSETSDAGFMSEVVQSYLEWTMTLQSDTSNAGFMSEVVQTNFNYLKMDNDWQKKSVSWLNQGLVEKF